MKLTFKQKVFIGLIGMTLFWFLIFYPYIVPWFISSNTTPILAVALFEATFFMTVYLATIFILGKTHKHSLKIAVALFLLYHVLDAIEPPFVLNTNGTFNTAGTSYIVSWDYGVGTFLQSTFNISGPALYYVTNIGVVVFMLLFSIWILRREQLLGRVIHQVLGD